MPAAPVLYDSTGTTPAEGPIVFGYITQGGASSEETYWLYNDGDEDLTEALFQARDENGATSGIAELDYAWMQIKFTGNVDDVADPTMEAQSSDWTAIGAFQQVLILDIPPGCGREIMVKVEVPGGVNATPREIVLAVLWDVIQESAESLWHGSFTVPLRYDGELSAFAGAAWGVCPFDSWLIGLRADVRVGATGGAVDRETVLDLNKNGVSVLDSPLAIVGEATSSEVLAWPTAAQSFGAGDVITLDIDSVDAATTLPADLIVTPHFVRR